MEQDERREAYRRELATIMQFDLAKAEAVNMRRKLDAEWDAMLAGRQEAPAEDRAPQIEARAERPSAVNYVTARPSSASICSAALTYCTARSRGESAHSSTRSPSPAPPSSDRSSDGWQSNRSAKQERITMELGIAESMHDAQDAVSEASPRPPPVKLPAAALATVAGPPVAPAQSPRAPAPRGKGVPPGLPPKSLAASPRASTSEMPEASPRGSPRAGGKGPPLPKGKGKGGPPPPLKGTGKGKGDETPGRTRLLALHWRNSLEPEDRDVSAAKDPYLTGIVQVLPTQRQKRYESSAMHFDSAFFQDDDVGESRALRHDEQDSSAMDDAGTPAASPRPGAAGAATPRVLDTPRDDETPRSAPMTPAGPTPGVQMTPGRGSRRRARRMTIFSEACTVRKMSQDKLEEYFQAKSSVIDMGPRASTGVINNLITDAKHLQIIDILVKKEAILRQRSMDASVEALIVALRTCDYDVAQLQVLEDIRKVTVAHMEDRNKANVLTFVDARGEEALQQLDHPHLHRLLYGALRIPAFNARLNCMIVEATFDDNMRHCKENLEVLRCGFECLSALLFPLRHFFQVARLLGNTLNRDCSATVSKYGFKLSSIPKFYEMKLPARKEISLLHFMALMMPPEQEPPAVT